MVTKTPFSLETNTSFTVSMTSSIFIWLLGIFLNVLNILENDDRLSPICLNVLNKLRTAACSVINSISLAERMSLDKRDLNESMLSKATMPFVKILESNVSNVTSENFLLAPALSNRAFIINTASL